MLDRKKYTGQAFLDKKRSQAIRQATRRWKQGFSFDHEDDFRKEIDRLRHMFRTSRRRKDNNKYMKQLDDIYNILFWFFPRG